MQVHAGQQLFDELERPWRELVGHAAGATPFQTWEWQHTWWAYYGRIREPLVFSAYEGDDLVGLMPFYRTIGPWRTLRPMGLGPSDYLHPLVRDGYDMSVAEALADWVASVKDVDLVDLHQIRETQSITSWMGAKKISQAICLVLDLPGSYDAYLSTIGKSLRYDVRKLDKSLFGTGRAQISTAGEESVDEDMNILLDQHRMRWRRRGLPGAFLGRSAAFQRRWVAQAARNGWLRLSVLKLDGSPIGAIYAMALGKTTYYYQAGFDPSHGSVSPGTLLVAHTIQQAIEEGAAHFDFMRGDEPYKRRWKPDHVYANLRIIAPRKGFAGILGSSWNQAGSRVEGRLRARLEGRGLTG